ncbi:hypothetical protein [Pelagimonas varians]|uniref:Uncharacterized protein n=1 Tax=Pelagimonas varians TaxID=696760 RepID=A0A238L2W7_9RHOB|nr:hypothetical protein [Pelagimonas varians]PYG27231.1 hypothetical protein C8N36_11777 [Pelagimonas varians]SMX48676.1 hypothetical protein PEV8663_03904 [Pelagimonas varians]
MSNRNQILPLSSAIVLGMLCAGGLLTSQAQSSGWQAGPSVFAGPVEADISQQWTANPDTHLRRLLAQN